MHPLDAAPERFGWRVWHIEGSRLISPIHRGKVRFGARVVESVCQHRSDPLELSPDCNCGIYYEDLDHAIERWSGEADRVGADNVALTFGAAVGDVAPDPVLPDDALRSPKWVILAILLPPASAAAARLRKRYNANVHMRQISPTAMQYVEDAVRGDLRRTPAPEFFDTLRAEPLDEGDAHIMDRHPDRFGWAVWRFHPDLRALSDPESPTRAIACRRNRSDAVYFEDEWGPGIYYVTTGFYCAQRIGGLEQAYLAAGWSDADFEFAATFGIADGSITPETDAWGAFYRARRHLPSIMCIPPSHGRLRQALERDWGIPVVSATSPQVFHNVEKFMRSKLARMSDEGLRRQLTQ
jgi:hypothetical protein